MESISLSSLLSSTITNNNNNEEQQIKQERRMNHTRMRIGNGIALFHDSQQNVWIYNRSKTCSIFIESPLYSKSSSKSMSIKKREEKDKAKKKIVLDDGITWIQ